MISGDGERHHGRRQGARRKAPNPPPPAKGLDGTVGVVGYLCLYLNIFFFNSLLAEEYARVDEEYALVEALWFAPARR